MIYSQNEKRILHILLSKFRVFFWGGKRYNEWQYFSEREYHPLNSTQ